MRTAATAATEAAEQCANDLRTQLATLNEAYAQERKQAQEKLALIEDAKAKMGNQFKVLASEIMTSHGEAFTTQNKNQIELILNPIRERMNEFATHLRQNQAESTKERAELAAQINQLSERSGEM